MGKKYAVWNGTDDIITPSGASFTAAEWASKYAWAKSPKTRMIIGAGVINGTVAYELFQTADQYRSMGADIPENITVDDADKVIDAIEAWEDLQKELAEEAAQIPSAEERIAAVLEEQQMDAQLANM